MSFPRYPEYKDSGVEWLGEMPSNWSRSALRHVVSRWYSGGTPDTDVADLWADPDDGVAWVSISDITRSDEISRTERALSYKGLAAKGLIVMPPRTLLISMYASIGKVATLAVPAAANQAILGMEFNATVTTRFIYYWLQHVERNLAQFSSSNTQENLNAAKVRAIPVFVPPTVEQSYIAAFLDRETSKIDALVAEQERLIALLKEKRQAVISHAVTKGLNPDAPMKDSGVDWVGPIPAHWTVTPLKGLTEQGRPIMYGIVLPGPDVGVGIPILKGGNVKAHRMNLDALARTTEEIEAPYARARLRTGDLVYSIRGTIGDCEEVPPALENCNITQDVARIAPRGDVSVSWLRFALLSHPLQEHLACGSLGAAVRGINIFDLKRVPVPTPPSEEQVAIAGYLANACARIDTLITEAEKSESVLIERRSALITAAVTGKIDVRGLASAEAA